jgi:hypothetical protein
MAATVPADQHGVARCLSLAQLDHALLGKGDGPGEEPVVQVAAEIAQGEYGAPAPEMHRGDLQVARPQRQDLAGGARLRDPLLEGLELASLVGLELQFLPEALEVFLQE